MLRLPAKQRVDQDYGGPPPPAPPGCDRARSAPPRAFPFIGRRFPRRQLRILPAGSPSATPPPDGSSTRWVNSTRVDAAPPANNKPTSLATASLSLALTLSMWAEPTPLNNVAAGVSGWRRQANPLTACFFWSFAAQASPASLHSRVCAGLWLGCRDHDMVGGSQCHPQPPSHHHRRQM